MGQHFDRRGQGPTPKVLFLFFIQSSRVSNVYIHCGALGLGGGMISNLISSNREELVKHVHMRENVHRKEIVRIRKNVDVLDGALSRYPCPTIPSSSTIVPKVPTPQSFIPVIVELDAERKTLKFNDDPEEDPNNPGAKTCRRYVKAVTDAVFEVTIVLSNDFPLPKEKARCQPNRGFILHDSDAHRQYALAGRNHQWHITPSFLPPGHVKLRTCSFLYFAITSTYPRPFFPFLTVPPFLA